MVGPAEIVVCARHAAENTTTATFTGTTPATPSLSGAIGRPHSGQGSGVTTSQLGTGLVSRAERMGCLQRDDAEAALLCTWPVPKSLVASTL